MRIRTIKPEFWMHEGLASKSEFTRLLAIALLNWADDDGYFMANPILIRGQLFPFQEDSKIIPRSLHELSRVGWIELSESPDGRAIGRIVNFRKHQRVDKPQLSKIKDLWTFPDDSKNDPITLQYDSKGEWKGMEGKGMEGIPPNPLKGESVKNSRFQKPTKKDVAEYSLEISANIDPDAFLDHYESNGWKVGKTAMKDWKASVRTWKRNQKERSQPKKKASLPDGFGV